MLHDKVIKLSQAKVHVYSYSVLCLGKIHEHPQSIRHWKDKIGRFMYSRDYRELNGIDGEPLEFEWNISRDTQYWNCFVRLKDNGKRQNQT